jgi:hypothetical protein
MKTSLALGNRRLSKLADILHVADEKHKKKGEQTYDQAMFMHICGAPACALGHWAVANPRRWSLIFGGLPRLILDGEYPLRDAMKEFCISEDEYDELFLGAGCGNAQTAKQAAAYIRRFVKARMQK